VLDSFAIVTPLQDYRDLVIEALADSEAAVIERVAELEALVEEALCDAESYRWLVQRLLDHWHAYIQRTDSIREENARLQRHIEQTMSEVVLT
jgi:hypothetical protein